LDGIFCVLTVDNVHPLSLILVDAAVADPTASLTVVAADAAVLPLLMLWILL